jgi:NAD(P)H-flavin reductase
MDPGSTVALLCGPEVMMRFAAPALAARGVTADRTYVSLERNMQCGIGHCGHCQLGPTLICRDGPVYRYADVERWLGVREL